MSFLRLLAAITALFALTAAYVVPASAEVSKPTPSCGLSVEDPAEDNNPSGSAATTSTDKDDGDVNLDILALWFEYDATKGDKGLTANLQVRDLSLRTPPGSTGVVWNIAYDANGQTRFVRAFTDAAGGPYFEYGSYLPAVTAWEPGTTPPSNVLPLARYAYEGGTEGEIFEGPNGIIRIVIPKEAGGGAGAKLESPFATGAASRQAVPAAVTQSPTRGVSTNVDLAPDDSGPGAGGSNFTVSSCSPVEQLADGPVAVADAPAPAASPAPAPAASAPGPVAEFRSAAPANALKLAVAPVKKVAKGKQVALKLSTGTALSRVTVTVRRGAATVASTKLAKLGATGTAKLKAKRALSKGRYTVTVVGTDAGGATKTATAALTVR